MGMDSMISRGDKLGNISVIHQYTQDLRIARQHYERNRDEASVAELEKALANLERQVQLMLGQIELPADRQRLDQQQGAVREYQQAFAELKQAGQRREASRGLLGDSADKAAALIGKSAAPAARRRYPAIPARGGNQRLLQQARFQVRGYTYSGKAEFQQTALTAIDQALAVLKPCRPSCPPNTPPASTMPPGPGRLPRRGEPVRQRPVRQRTNPAAHGRPRPAAAQHQPGNDPVADRGPRPGHPGQDPARRRHRLALLLGVLAAWPSPGRSSCPCARP
jgi:hypothetical protein